MDPGNLIKPERSEIILAHSVERPKSCKEEVPLHALRVHELGDIFSRVDSRGLPEASDEVLLGSHADCVRFLLLLWNLMEEGEFDLGRLFSRSQSGLGLRYNLILIAGLNSSHYPQSPQSRVCHILELVMR